jgi:aconitate hydratase
MENIRASMEQGTVTVREEESGRTFTAVCELTQRQRNILLAGGLLNYTKEGAV